MTGNNILTFTLSLTIGHCPDTYSNRWTLIASAIEAIKNCQCCQVC